MAAKGSLLQVFISTFPEGPDSLLMLMLAPANETTAPSHRPKRHCQTRQAFE